MLFNEFGDKDKPVVLCLHGMLQDWHTEYELVKPLETDFRLIIPAMNGMYVDSPEFTNFADQCEEMESYIHENYGGYIHGVFGCSQGATVLSELLARNKVKVDVAVLDGIYLAHQGNLAAWFGYKVFCKVKNEGGKFPKSMNIVMNLMGLKEEDLQMFDAICWDVLSDTSLKNNLYENYNYHVNTDIKNTNTRIHLWCGEKEPYAIKSHNILKKYLANYEEKIFNGMGHGEMMLKRNKEFFRMVKAVLGD